MGAAMIRLRLSRCGLHVILIVGSALMLAPFVWQFLTSVKSLNEATQVPPTLWPTQWIWTNYSDVFSHIPYAMMYLNTVLYAIIRTAGQLLFCSAAAYAFARLRFPGRGLIFAVCLSALMIPPELFILSQYQIMKGLGWLNTLQALFTPTIFSAFGTFLLRQFFVSLPVDVEEAARLDGCGPFQIYWRVMLPLAKPGLVALGILTVIAAWSDLLWPLIVNTQPQKMTLAVGLAALQGELTVNYPVIMAAALIATAPLVLVFLFMQRRVVEGIAMSGSKG